MPLFATCAIANTICALCAPSGALTFSSWVCAVPLRFDTLAGSRLARRLPGIRCRALRCAPVSRCNAGGSACLLACRALHWCVQCLAAGLARPCGCSSGRATWVAICHGYRAPAYLAGAVGQTVHADHFDGLDHERTRRVDSTVLAAPAIVFRTACVMFAPAPQGSAPRAACRRHRPRCARLHCKSITMCVPGRARVRLPALSLLPGMP